MWSIAERAAEEEEYYVDKGNEESEEEEKKEYTKKNTGKNKKATAETFSPITDYCDYLLNILQSVAVMSPQVIAAPLSLFADKHARIWSHWWLGNNLPTPAKTTPQFHTGITVVLSNITTKLQTEEALRPVVAA